MVAWYILESPKYSQHRHWGFVKGQFKNELVILLFQLKNGNQSVGSCRGDRLDCARWNSSWSLFIWIELCLPSKYGRTISLYLPYPRLLIPSYSKMNIGTYLTIEIWLKKTYFLYTSKFQCTTYSNIIELNQNVFICSFTMQTPVLALFLRIPCKKKASRWVLLHLFSSVAIALWAGPGVDDTT